MSESTSRQWSGPNSMGRNFKVVWLSALCTCVVNFTHGNVLAEVSKPGTPQIELLEELPEAVITKELEVTQEEGALAAAPQVSKVFRPQSDTLTGSDPFPGVARPSYLESVQGMDSDIRITRITPNESFGRHSYSKRQAWNADETKVDLNRKVLDATNNYSLILTHTLTGERSWSTTNPNLLYGVARDPDPNNFASYNLTTQKRTILRTFFDYEKCTIGEYEGSLSVGDEYVLLACAYSSGKTDLISYDIANNAVLGKIQAASDFNWGSFSQSGKYILVENNEPGQSANRELIRYDKNLQNKKIVATATNHGDFGLDDNGDDVYVMIAWDKISYIRLHDGVRINLGITDRAGDGHVSCRAIKRPGWCYFSSKNEYQRIGAVKISETDSVVEVWGFSKSSFSKYTNQPQVTVSPSGRKLMFTSDWWKPLNKQTPHPGGGGDGSEYVLELVN